MHLFVTELEKKLALFKDASLAKKMEAYMKNNFSFLGIPMPLRRHIFKSFLKEHSINNPADLEKITLELWDMPHREFQYCAVELLGCNKVFWQPESIYLFEKCIEKKSWWDTVDFIISQCLGPFFKKNPTMIPAITGQWNASENIWLQRCSILFQKNYKQNTDQQLLTTYIQKVSRSKEFFVQKAIGWSLREYAKSNAQWVIEFVKDNDLPSLSKREALKNLKQGERN